MAEFAGVEARTMRADDELARGVNWWRVTSIREEARKLGGPVVRLRCVDHRGEIQDFTLPADLHVRFRRS